MQVLSDRIRGAARLRLGVLVLSAAACGLGGPVALGQAASDAGAIGVDAEAREAAARSARKLRTLDLAPSPRLMLTHDRLAVLRQTLETDALAGRWFAAVRREADRLLDDPVARHELPDGVRLLPVSRTVLFRAYTLGLVYRVTGEGAYAERLWIELEAAAGFPDWNAEGHFLDAAEMAHAFAIGIDWLGGWLGDERRRFLVDAVCRNTLEPAARAYNSAGRGRGWWVSRYESNWNAVCNGGVILGALAVADDRPELASRVLSEAVRSLRPHIREYGQDGGWAEGPSYWSYGTRYLAPVLDSLETSVGDELALGSWPAFTQTGAFALAMTTPTGGVFNFADASERFEMRAPQLHYLARRFGQPSWSAYASATARPDARDLLWYTPAPRGDDRFAWPPARAHAPALAQYFRGVGVAVMRTAWDDRQAAFLGYKLGRTGVPHGHLDVGSFIYEVGGVRWVFDPGPDSYLLPGYFEGGAMGRRWLYHRLRAGGHSAPLVNPWLRPDQDLGAEATLLAFDAGRGPAERGALAVADLSALYASSGAEGVGRGVELFDDGSVRVRDEALLKRPGRYVWSLYTRAGIRLTDDGRTAWLTQDGKRLAVRLREPAGARWSVLPAEPLPGAPNPSGQRAMADAKRLALVLDNTTSASVVATLALDAQHGGPMRPMAEFEPLRPLRQWALAQDEPAQVAAPE